MREQLTESDVKKIEEEIEYRILLSFLFLSFLAAWYSKFSLKSP